jgi:hypothetical protein
MDDGTAQESTHFRREKGGFASYTMVKVDLVA